MTTRSALRPPRQSRGFTLVELLIVVVILAILAAVVIPQFENTSASAKEAALVSNLQTIRQAIPLYRDAAQRAHEALGDNHMHTLRMEYELALAHGASGDRERAETCAGGPTEELDEEAFLPPGVLVQKHDQLAAAPTSDGTSAR